MTDVPSRKRSKVDNGIHESDGDDSSSDDGNDEEYFEDPQLNIFEGGVKCLFCDTIFPDPLAVFNCCSSKHKFNIFDFPKHNKSFIDYIKLINFIRSEKSLLNDDGTVINDVFDTFLRVEDDAQFLQPVIENDLLLCFDFDSHNICNADSSDTSLDVQNIENGHKQSSNTECENEMLNWDKSELAKEIVLLRRKLSNAENLLDESDSRLRKTSELLKFLAEDDDIARDGSVNCSPPLPSKEDPDKGYFDSYDSLSIHEEMIQDKVRTSSYHKFITYNKPLFSGKTILDLGCGTGILSLFAASSGAKKVIALDQSNIAKLAQKIVNENNYEAVIEVVNDKAENLKLGCNCGPIDVIISEWMGYFLLYECMLDSVITLRDRCHNEFGYKPRIYPRFYSVFVCALSNEDIFHKQTMYWEDVYGFKMNAVQELLKDNAIVTEVKESDVCSNAFCVKKIDAMTATVEYTEFESDFVLEVKSDSPIHAICGYFDVQFSDKTIGDEHERLEVSFSTGPLSAMTHWKQVVFVLHNPIEAKKNDEVKGCIRVRRNAKDPRSINVTINTDLEVTEYCLK